MLFKHKINTHIDKKKIFLLCLGTQKAGTSWLFDFLRNIDGVGVGFQKELHVFDRLDYPEFIQEDLLQLKKASEANAVTQSTALLKRLSMISNSIEYFDYFEYILLKGNTYVTGDFTPEHCLLSSQRLDEIKNEFNARGIKVKVIFLMRDPVERIWSAQRMTQRHVGGCVTLLDSYKAKYIEMLTRYELIVPKIESVFDKSDIYINFYENLFTPKAIKDILEFLGLPDAEPDFSKMVNHGAYVKIDPSDRKLVEEYYAETYSFMKSRFSNIYPSIKVRHLQQSSK